MRDLNVYIISDSIGETGELIATAAMKQFDLDSYRMFRYPYHNSLEKIKPVLEDASIHKNSIVIYTTVEKRAKEYIETQCYKLGIPSVDVMEPPLAAIERIIGEPPKREPGLIRRLDDNYFRKVEAVEFAIQHDDGKNPRGIELADIVILGISRTSKTPLSIYLANKLFKVTNIPLVPEVDIPHQIFSKDKRRIIGLIAQPSKVSSIRAERLESLGLDSSAEYSEIQRINEELNYSLELMRKLDCLIIDVTNKSIEETAGIIMAHMRNSFK